MTYLRFCLDWFINGVIIAFALMCLIIGKGIAHSGRGSLIVVATLFVGFEIWGKTMTAVIFEVTGSRADSYVYLLTFVFAGLYVFFLYLFVNMLHPKLLASMMMPLTKNDLEKLRRKNETG